MRPLLAVRLAKWCMTIFGTPAVPEVSSSHSVRKEAGAASGEA